MNVTVVCDECGGMVEGHVSHTDGWTGGFYLRGWVVPYGKGTQNDMFPDGKHILCDYCMQNSDSYKKLYGDKAALAAVKPEARSPRGGERVRSYIELQTYIREGQFHDE
jgi:hypothetical protein